MTQKEYEDLSAALLFQRDQLRAKVDEMRGRLSDAYLKEVVLERVSSWLGDVETVLVPERALPMSREIGIRLASFSMELAGKWADVVARAMTEFGDDVTTV